MRRDDQAIPEPLRLVVDFVNTLDVEEITDPLAPPAALADWCRDHVGTAADLTVTRKDLAAAIEVRDVLRNAMLANRGVTIRPEDLAEHNRRITRFQAGVEFAETGRPIVQARGAGVTEILSRILVDVATAHALGIWDRTKLCPAEDCLWAFYDHSKNRSRRWCSMDLCGNRTKTKTYRQRHRAT